MVSDHSPSLPTASSLAWGSGGFTWVSTGGQTSALKCASGDRPGMSVPPPTLAKGGCLWGGGPSLDAQVGARAPACAKPLTVRMGVRRGERQGGKLQAGSPPPVPTPRVLCWTSEEPGRRGP